MNVNLRYAVIEDVDQVIDINMRAWQTAYKGIIDQNYLDNFDKESKIKRWKENFNSGKIIVATVNDDIVGFCRYIDSNKMSADYSNVDCEIVAIYVDPNFKRMGIGRKMFNRVMNEFKALLVIKSI